MSADAMMLHAVPEKTVITEAESAFFLQNDAVELVRWQSLWVSLVAKPWRTLAVVPVGQWTLASDVVGRLVDAAHSMRQDAYSIGGPAGDPGTPGHAILPLASPLHAPAAALAARKSDAVLMVVSLGRDTLEQARTVRDLIGAARFVGCLAVNEGRAGR